MTESTLTRVALSPTQLPIVWVSGFFPWEYETGVKLTTHLNLQLRILGSKPRFPHTSAFRGV